MVLLEELWKPAVPLDGNNREILEDIVSLEICNWNLEAALTDLCRAIGTGIPCGRSLGHMASVSRERWLKLWTYYLAVRSWLPSLGENAYGCMLDLCDPDCTVRAHVRQLLGHRTPVKELLAERFCLCLEMWLGGFLPTDSAQMTSHRAAVRAIDTEILKISPEDEVLKAMRMDGEGALQPCHHKAFRRYDIILSSIGEDVWRGTIPIRGTDGFDRARLLEQFLRPLRHWLDGEEAVVEGEELSPTGRRVVGMLGNATPIKRFLTSLLVSLLRCQELAALKKARQAAGGGS
jgi:hypothetical protein